MAHPKVLEWMRKVERERAERESADEAEAWGEEQEGDQGQARGGESDREPDEDEWEALEGR